MATENHRHITNTIRDLNIPAIDLGMLSNESTRMEKAYIALIKLFAKVHSGVTLDKLPDDILENDDVRSCCEHFISAAKQLVASMQEQGFSENTLYFVEQAANPTTRPDWKEYYGTSKTTPHGADGVNLQAQRFADALKKALPGHHFIHNPPEISFEGLPIDQQATNHLAAIQLAAAFLEPAASIIRIMGSNRNTRETEITQLLRRATSVANKPAIDSESWGSKIGGPLKIQRPEGETDPDLPPGNGGKRNRNSGRGPGAAA